MIVTQQASTVTANRLSGDTEAETRHRVRNLLETEIDFIANAEFEQGLEELDTTVEDVLRSAEDSSDIPADLPAHLRRMCESDLLTHEQEEALFREMNFLKFQANLLREQLKSDCVDVRMVEQIESLLARSRQIRDHIIKANTRLVMSIVKKFVTPQNSFDDMLSDGMFTLMQAVEKFDYDRGFRFSTYAYRSIARHAYRTVVTARKEEGRYTRDAEAWAFEEEGDLASSSLSDRVWNNLRDLTSSMLEGLDRRERFIIRCRYALGSHRQARTFQYMAEKLGISKERVRQLEKRAVSKLQDMAAEFDADELFGVAMA